MSNYMIRSLPAFDTSTSLRVALRHFTEKDLLGKFVPHSPRIVYGTNILVCFHKENSETKEIMKMLFLPPDEPLGAQRIGNILQRYIRIYPKTKVINKNKCYLYVDAIAGFHIHIRVGNGLRCIRGLFLFFGFAFLFVLLVELCM